MGRNSDRVILRTPTDWLLGNKPKRNPQIKPVYLGTSLLPSKGKSNQVTGLREKGSNFLMLKTEEKQSVKLET